MGRGKTARVEPLPPNRKRKASESNVGNDNEESEGNHRAMVRGTQQSNTRRRTGHRNSSKNMSRRDEDEEEEGEEGDGEEDDGESGDWQDEDEEEDPDQEEEEEEELEEIKPAKVPRGRKPGKAPYRKTTMNNPNGRQKGRNLINWKEPKDHQILLILYHELHAAGIDPAELWNKVVKRLHNDPNKTGPSVSQHIDKLRQRVFEAGGLVPPWNGRDNCPTISQEFRGVVKVPRRNNSDPGWRDITWDEEFVENINTKMSFNTSDAIGGLTVTRPGRKPERRLAEEDKGYEGASPPLRRKIKSDPNLLRINGRHSLPFVKPGYSVRHKPKTNYTKKGSKPSRKKTAAKPKTGRGKKKQAPPSESSPSDEEDSIKDEEESESESEDESEDDRPIASLPPRPLHMPCVHGSGGGRMVGKMFRRDLKVKPQKRKQKCNAEFQNDEESSEESNDDDRGDEIPIKDNSRNYEFDDEPDNRMSNVERGNPGAGYSPAQSSMQYGYGVRPQGPAPRIYMQARPEMGPPMSTSAYGGGRGPSGGKQVFPRPQMSPSGYGGMGQSSSGGQHAGPGFRPQMSQMVYGGGMSQVSGGGQQARPEVHRQMSPSVYSGMDQGSLVEQYNSNHAMNRPMFTGGNPQFYDGLPHGSPNLDHWSSTFNPGRSPVGSESMDVKYEAEDVGGFVPQSSQGAGGRRFSNQEQDVDYSNHFSNDTGNNFFPGYANMQGTNGNGYAGQGHPQYQNYYPDQRSGPQYNGPPGNNGFGFTPQSQIRRYSGPQGIPQEPVEYSDGFELPDLAHTPGRNNGADIADDNTTAVVALMSPRFLKEHEADYEKLADDL